MIKMIRYICEQCGTAFDEPIIKETMAFSVDGFPKYDIEKFCPICCSYYFTPADYCQCGEAKRKGDKLCGRCKRIVFSKFSEFCDELTEQEVDQLDEWLDGESIKERKRWGIEYPLLKADRM